MFVMTSDITIGNHRVKPSDVQWQTSASDFADTCTIRLPMSIYARTDGTTTKVAGVPNRITKTAFRKGDKVEVRLGYNGKNTLRFSGFVSRVNLQVPLTIDCEGYSYQLKDKLFTKSYKTTTAKDVLKDLIEGTDIELSEYIPNIPLTNVWFRQAPGLKVLEWFKSECLCRVCFYGNILYVGASKYAVPKPSAKLRLRWNTVTDDLTLDNEDEPTELRVVERDSSGKKCSHNARDRERRKYSNQKDLKVRQGLPSELVQKALSELQSDENYKGYSGTVTCFLEPHFEHGMTAEIADERFPARSGKYYVDTVQGSFGQNGGRQQITLTHYGKV